MDSPDEIPKFMVKDVLNDRLQKLPSECPICRTRTIETTIDTMHDRACTGCRTKFDVVERRDGRAIYEVDINTVPFVRIQRSLYQRAHEEAVLSEWQADDAEDDA